MCILALSLSSTTRFLLASRSLFSPSSAANRLSCVCRSSLKFLPSFICSSSDAIASASNRFLSYSIAINSADIIGSKLGPISGGFIIEGLLLLSCSSCFVPTNLSNIFLDLNFIFKLFNKTTIFNKITKEK
ncbi:hypothetical protein [Candidatus Phytoplasma luffae]|uniref:hypothetical protein n=1 Tax=Loofah witches'-broom phytoplasma TaxID=35773 RepID=UPI001B392A9B|nr:hypothetical protein [Candidatus Phytoplasma luffae]